MDYIFIAIGIVVFSFMFGFTIVYGICIAVWWCKLKIQWWLEDWRK
jgi:hypothetical protein